MLKRLVIAGAAFCASLTACQQADNGVKSSAVQAPGNPKAIGVSVASLGNPFFVALAKGATDEAGSETPPFQVTALAYGYDIGKQYMQIGNFIAAGVSLILLNPSDPRAIAPAIRKAQAAGIPVVAMDTLADGADAAVATDNVQYGTVSCQYLVDKMGGKGNLVILNGPQVAVVIDRVNGCRKVLAAHPGITLVSSDQDEKGSRAGASAVTKSLLTRFPQVDGVFAINDPEAIGVALAAKQMQRTTFPITSVDGSPDIEVALKDPGMAQIVASASQDPYTMARAATAEGVQILAGKKPANPVTLLPSVLVTRDNVGSYKGWAAVR